MNITKMINDMYESKIINLIDSGFELTEESENDCIAYKEEIIANLIPMVQKCLKSEEENLEEDEIFDIIYDYDNVWRNAIYNIFKGHNISDELLNEYFENPDDFQKHIFQQWQVNEVE